MGRGGRAVQAGNSSVVRPGLWGGPRPPRWSRPQQAVSRAGGPCRTPVWFHCVPFHLPDAPHGQESGRHAHGPEATPRSAIACPNLGQARALAHTHTPQLVAALHHPLPSTPLHTDGLTTAPSACQLQARKGAQDLGRLGVRAGGKPRRTGALTAARRAARAEQQRRWAPPLRVGGSPGVLCVCAATA